MDDAAPELHILGALQPVEGVTVGPVVTVPDPLTRVLCVHVQRAHAAKMGVGKLEPCRHAGEGIRYALPLPAPVVEHIAQVKFVDQVGSKGAVQAKYGIAWINRIAGSGSRNAEFVPRQEPSDIDLIGAGGPFTGIPVREKKAPLVA